ncbi:MAG: 50S ribosomal protein L25 [Chloroflexi bacterium]|nr:MAG: 50S ribosomal protein L25 [Chloroflexota bacterium]
MGKDFGKRRKKIMEQLKLQAMPRTAIGKQVKQLRREGLLPGIIYGHSIEPLAVQFDAREARSIADQAGSSSLINVYIAGTPTPYSVIIRDVQWDYLKRTLIHLDLQALSMTEKVRIPISINLVGTAAAVEELGGVLLHLVNEVDVECLPSALVPAIDVDISNLTQIGDSISVKDLVVPEGIEILTDAEETVVQISAVVEEAEEKEEFAVEAEAGDVEVIGEEEEAEAEE